MIGFASAQAAFEAPPGDGPDLVECPECGGSGEIVECANDGKAGCSHTNDETWRCDICKGAGEVDPRDLPAWCDRCGLSGRCPDCDPPDRDDDR